MNPSSESEAPKALALVAELFEAFTEKSVGFIEAERLQVTNSNQFYTKVISIRELISILKILIIMVKTIFDTLENEIWACVDAQITRKSGFICFGEAKDKILFFRIESKPVSNTFVSYNLCETVCGELIYCFSDICHWLCLHNR